MTQIQQYVELQADWRTVLGANTVQKALQAACGQHIDPAQMCRVMMHQMDGNPKLAACDPQSIVGCMIEAGALGLMIDGTQASLVPFGDTCTLIIGYQGMTEVMHRSSKVGGITMGTSHGGDMFDFDTGSRAFVRHRKGQEPRDPATLEYAYATAEMVGGRVPLIAVLNRAEVNARMKRSSAWEFAEGLTRSKSHKAGQKDSPWHTDYGAMAQKSAVRELAKLAPKTDTLRRVLDSDMQAEIGSQVAAQWAAEAGVQLASSVSEQADSQRASAARVVSDPKGNGASGGAGAPKKRAARKPPQRKGAASKPADTQADTGQPAGNSGSPDGQDRQAGVGPCVGRDKGALAVCGSPNTVDVPGVGPLCEKHHDGGQE